MRGCRTSPAPAAPPTAAAVLASGRTQPARSRPASTPPPNPMYTVPSPDTRLWRKSEAVRPDACSAFNRAVQPEVGAIGSFARSAVIVSPNGDMRCVLRSAAMVATSHTPKLTQ